MITIVLVITDSVQCLYLVYTKLEFCRCCLKNTIYSAVVEKFPECGKKNHTQLTAVLAQCLTD